MSSMQEDIQCAGSDTRPPMLDRTDFESWQQHIRLYCLGKDNGENIMKSIKEGPFRWDQSKIVITGERGAVHTKVFNSARVLNDLSAEEKERYKADIRATNILLQGIPKDIYSLINHYTNAKDIWENVKMILEGFELTKDDRESQLYDEFEHFRQNKGETIQGYYVRFTKIINDIRNIKMTMSRMQLNSKFVNNMLPEWSRFITEVKLNRGLKESNCDSGRESCGSRCPWKIHGIIRKHFSDTMQEELDSWECRRQTGEALSIWSSEKPTREQVTNVDDNVDDSPENDLALNVDHVFEADECDAFDSDVDEDGQQQEKAETLAPKTNFKWTVNVPPNTPVKLVPRVLPTKSQVKINLYVLIQLFTEFDKTCKTRITPSGLTEGKEVLSKQKDVTSWK
ncbi:hypothetical protein Tco_0316500 [Tanacetum coccineum]